MIELVLKLGVSYLLGSILGSLVLGRARGVDIRRLGSGNAGSTNALRTQGKVFALGVMLIDVGKGWLATQIVPQLPLPLAPAPSVIHNWLPAACGAAAMLGHVYPLWFGLRGGKAVATLLGAILGLAPRLLFPVALAWIAGAVLTGFVSVASIAAAAMLPVAVVAAGLAWRTPLLGFGLFSALLVLFTHRANLRRLRAGCEPRAQRLWWFGRRAPS